MLSIWLKLFLSLFIIMALSFGGISYAGQPKQALEEIYGQELYDVPPAIQDEFFKKVARSWADTTYDERADFLKEWQNQKKSLKERKEAQDKEISQEKKEKVSRERAKFKEKQAKERDEIAKERARISENRAQEKKTKTITKKRKDIMKDLKKAQKARN